MGDELNDWKRQASVSVQVWHLLHSRHRFSPTLFLLFSFWGSCWRSGMNYSGENMKVEHKKQKVKREAFDNIDFPSCFYQIKRIILLNVLSSPSHPPWASFQTDFLIFYMFGRGLYSSSCKFPLNFELLFSTASFCVIVSVWSLLVIIQQSYKYRCLQSILLHEKWNLMFF